MDILTLLKTKKIDIGYLNYCIEYSPDENRQLIEYNNSNNGELLTLSEFKQVKDWLLS